jgi:hypothetical protein
VRLGGQGMSDPIAAGDCVRVTRECLAWGCEAPG